jgi:hypothetical protein
MTERWTEASIFELLQKRYEAPAWALLPQVADGTGANANRRADAVAMSLYPSRGLEIHGFEIKVRRRDWLNELANPGKADAVAIHCDRWWIVAPPGVVELAELPTPWGLFEVGSNRRDFDDRTPTKAALLVKKAPEAMPIPTAGIERAFLAAVLRRVYEHATPAAEFERVRAETRAEVWDEATKFHEGQKTLVAEKFTELKLELHELQSALGYAKPEDVAHAIKVLRALSGRRRDSLSELSRHVQDLSESVAGLVRLASEFVDEGGSHVEAVEALVDD